MRIQSVLGASDYGAAGAGNSQLPIPEKIFGLFRNAYTKTATITAATLMRGSPAILTAASASNNGYDVVNAQTLGETANDLLVGVVYDYPDTTVAKNGLWQPEDLGWVQVYGMHDAVLLAVASTTIAANLLLSPDTGSQFQTTLRQYFDEGTAAAGTAHLAPTGMFGGLVMLYQTVASQEAGTKAVKAFIRCM